MAGYKVDRGVPFLSVDSGKVVGYIADDGREYALDGSLLNKDNLDPVAAINERLDVIDEEIATTSSALKTRRVGVIGDSRMADIASKYGVYDRQRQARNWLNIFLAANGHPWDVISASVEAGKRTDEYLVGFDEMISGDIDTLIFGYPCLNDIAQNYPTAETSADVAFENLRSKVVEALNNRKRVIAVTEVGATSLTTAQVGAVEKFNRKWIEFFGGLAGKNAYLFDARPTVHAPSSGSTAQAFKTNYLYDNAHFGALGAQAVANAFSAWLSATGINYASRENEFLACSSLELYSINSIDVGNNPLFLTTTGGSVRSALTGKVTGSVPDGWYLDAASGVNVSAVSISTSDNSDGFGKDVTISLSANAGGWASILFSSDIWPMSQISAGEAIQVGIQCELVSGSGAAPAARIYPSTFAESLFPEAYTNAQDVVLPQKFKNRHIVMLPTVPSWCSYGAALKVPGGSTGVFKISRARCTKRISDVFVADLV